MVLPRHRGYPRLRFSAALDEIVPSYFAGHFRRLPALLIGCHPRVRRFDARGHAQREHEHLQQQLKLSRE